VIGLLIGGAINDVGACLLYWSTERSATMVPTSQHRRSILILA